MDEERFQRARRLHPPEVESLLAEHYQRVARVTFAIVGRADTAPGIVRYVMRRALKVLPKWEHAADAPRWFNHHTIISTRRAAIHKPRLDHDTLRGPQPQPKYLAYVGALRDLPSQQREALILQDCEGMDLRQTAVAMDCSTEAAANHLEAARRQLRLIAGADADRLSAALKRTYEGLTPPEDLILPSVRRQVRRHAWPRRIKKALMLLMLLVILAAVYWYLAKFGLIPEQYRTHTR